MRRIVGPLEALGIQRAGIAERQLGAGIHPVCPVQGAEAAERGGELDGIGVGGAYGKGLVIQNDRVMGKTALSQLTVGLQLGGQVYSQFIFFRDQTALDSFRRGNFEFGAQASAVAVTLGASADANYDKGVAVFTHVGGGLMYEASIAGGGFTYEPL